MSRIEGKTLIDRFEQFAPRWLAEEGDPVGLAVGTLHRPIKKVLVTLDVRPEVVKEAIEKKVDLIFAHHPPIFRPLSTLETDSPQNKMYADLLKHDIAVYAAHTNLDVAEGGMNDWLATELGIEEAEILSITKRETYKKLAVYVPVESEAAVTSALHQAGAGEVGDYKNVSYLTAGEGRFTPQAGAHPTIGKVGDREIVKEVKVELMVPESGVPAALQALKEAHPYEEPVFDLYTLEQTEKNYGLGRIGMLPEAIPLKEYIHIISQKLDVEGLRYITDNPNKLIQKVAVLGGDGGKFYGDAVQKEADVFITGDVYYHTGHDMLADGLSVIDPGHHIESICKKQLVQLFNGWAKEEKWDIEIAPSKWNTDPFRYYPSL